LAKLVIDVRNDVRELDALQAVIDEHKPQVVFHLAAQPIVRVSYEEPKETFGVNVGGTVNLLEAVRLTGSVRAFVCVTTDKVYDDQEWLWGYRENDRLGGHDPYSASKAMAELAVASYRRSFFPAEKIAEHGVGVASARAGNVIGGGDWGKDRLVPDCMRALMEGRVIPIRFPSYVRPWQLVLEPLAGYLWLGAKLLQEGGEYAEAWNFGPREQAAVTVRELVQTLIEGWGSGEWKDVSSEKDPHETALLRLSWEKAANRLDWQPVYDWHEAAAATVDWHKTYHEGGSGVDMYGPCVEHIRQYVDRARELGVAWAR
jgi:CDP-glucose 4,6-dehydratase